MTNLTVITPPAGEAVTLAQAKDFLAIGHAGEDGLISDLIFSARARVEQASGLVLVTQTLRRNWPRWPAGIAGRGARLTPGPVTALVAVRVVEESGIVTDHTGRFRLEAGRLCLRAWSMVPAVPEGGRIEVDFEAGFGVPGTVPEDLVLAVLLVLSDAYRTGPLALREAPGEGALPDDVVSILDARRGVRL